MIATKQARFVDYSDYTPNLLTADLTWLFDQLADLAIDTEGQEWRTYWLGFRQDMRNKYLDYKARPVRQGRDNKDVFNGSGYGSGNTIRYPRKARSKKCWERFYKLFPYARPRVEESESAPAIPRRLPGSGVPPKFELKKR